MTENIRPAYEGKNGLMLNMVERLTRVETKLDSIDDKIESIIQSIEHIENNYEPRMEKLEAKSNQAEGALKMLKYAFSAIGAVVLTIIGYLFKIR